MSRPTSARTSVSSSSQPSQVPLPESHPTSPIHERSPRLSGSSFYNRLADVLEPIDGWIDWGFLIPGTQLRKLYVRGSYISIASEIFNRNQTLKKAIITGIPGVGKSLFLIYFLWTLVKESKRVVLVFKTYIIYFDGFGGIHVLSCCQDLKT